MRKQYIRLNAILSNGQQGKTAKQNYLHKSQHDFRFIYGICIFHCTWFIQVASVQCLPNDPHGNHTTVDNLIL